jgi:tetratricopeptide (TPR) repeat protein
MTTSLLSLTQHANALKAAGRIDEAVGLYRKAVERYPLSAVAEHNLAAALGDSGQPEEAIAVTDRAFAKGLDAAETWLVRARALAACDQYDAALAAYEAATRRQANLPDAYYELAQLRWMLTADRGEAMKAFDLIDPAGPIAFAKARALQFMGDPPAARATLELLRQARPADPAVLAFASQLGLDAGAPDEALALAIAAVRAAPDFPPALEAYCIASLATGRPPDALAAAERLRRLQPMNQHALALEATALRLMGEARSHALYDYAAFVRSYAIDVPAGWLSLQAYLNTLAEELRALQAFRTHPFGQSVRHGSQRPNILGEKTPAIAAFREAISGPVEAYIARLGQGSDPLRRRNTGGWAIGGAWSVWLQPGGYHTDHVHPDGWISSACYIEVPGCSAADGRAGWLRFGKPGAPTRPALEAEHWVQPRPGQLALFPSYMWHGTEMFDGAEARLTIAFDIVPAGAPARAVADPV